MCPRLVDEIKQTKPFASPYEEAFLEVERTAEALAHGMAELLKSYGITPTQYNVLRILRGAGEPGLPCSDVGGRMVTHDPDVTRLLDRLERMGLVTRGRSTEDRRVVITRITPEGLELVNRLDEPVLALHAKQLGHLSGEQLASLVEGLQKARENVEY
jgi:DNA-binding MarR family transcriptional regulator